MNLSTPGPGGYHMHDEQTLNRMHSSLGSPTTSLSFQSWYRACIEHAKESHLQKACKGKMPSLKKPSMKPDGIRDPVVAQQNTYQLMKEKDHFQMSLSQGVCQTAHLWRTTIHQMRLRPLHHKGGFWNGLFDQRTKSMAIGPPRVCIKWRCQVIQCIV